MERLERRAFGRTAALGAILMPAPYGPFCPAQLTHPKCSAAARLTPHPGREHCCQTGIRVRMRPNHTALPYRSIHW